MYEVHYVDLEDAEEKKLFLNLPSSLYLYLLMLTSCNWMPSQFILTMASS